MLDYQDATNRDQKGLPFTVSADMTCRSPLGEARLSVTLTIPAPDYGQIRTVFIIDPKKVIRLTISYPASTGRNFDEIVRYVLAPPCCVYGDVR